MEVNPPRQRAWSAPRNPPTTTKPWTPGGEHTAQDVMYRADESPKRHRSRLAGFHRRFSCSGRFFWVAIASSAALFVLLFLRLGRYPIPFRHNPPPKQEDGRPPSVWEGCNLLERYWGGLRTLGPAAQRTIEYPHGDEKPQISVKVKQHSLDANSMPRPRIHDPYPDYSSSAYIAKYGKVETCFLDEARRTAIPKIQAYEGAVQGFPDPIIGSHEVVGLPSNLCYDRYARYGAYGYGFSQAVGGTGAGLREGVQEQWQPESQVDYTKVRWGEAQNQCYLKNKHRFPPRRATAEQDDRKMGGLNWINNTSSTNDEEGGSPRNRIPRTAIIIRIWRHYRWSQEAIVYMRGLISELSLLSGGEYQVHFLIQVKDTNIPIWDSNDVYEEVVRDALPPEFEGMGTLWSESQMALLYTDLFENHAAGLPVHGVYRSAHFPVQWFAHNHPEYEYFWNWEMDIRYTGNWYNFFESLRSFARKQPRKGLWIRNERFYVPSVHGSWAQFTALANEQAGMPVPDDADGTPRIWGPKAPHDAPSFPEDPMPPRRYDEDNYQWGVGEEADLITLNPIFNPHKTGWRLNGDTTGYDKSRGKPIRRTAIVTASRLSRRLLMAMHTEVRVHHHTMFTEMWAPSVALHHGLKAVYAPHPVYVERAWPPSSVAKTFNGGVNGASGGAWTSPFGLEYEDNFQPLSWYYNSAFPGRFWRRWLGLKVDGKGGEKAEMAGEGRMCAPPMLLHPIKDVEFETQP